MSRPQLHDRIREELESLILSGEWPVGHRIPPEHELMARYDCSRMTVSRAILGLVARGYVERRKRAGSFVKAPLVHRAVIEFPEIAAEIAAAGGRHELRLIARSEREATPEDRRLLGIAAGPVLALACLHLRDGTPFALEMRLINLTIVPEARSVDFARESPGRWLLGHVPWSDARHEIGAVAASAEIARSLAIDEGAPCQSVERWTWRTAERITHVRQIYPASHRLTARFLA